MHPIDCPAWDYESHPQHASVLTQQLYPLLTELVRGGVDTLAKTQDTRPVHKHLFAPFTDTGYEYFAGHYRGEDFRCLKFYEVEVQSDPRVGAEAQVVQRRMAYLATTIKTLLAAMDTAYQIPNAAIPERQKLRDAISLSCRVFVEFLTIHPYANGNGHLARFILTAILQRYGYRLRHFPIDPRPEPPYMEGIKAYRNGDMRLLEAFVLNCTKK